MADVRGKLSKEELKRAFAWLKDKVKIRTCPLCENEEMTLSDSLYAMPLFSQVGLIVNTVMPTVTITCEHCGYIRFFNAVSTGIVPPYLSPPEK